MTDTVKLIIEIPKELHEALLNGYEEPYSRMFSDVVKNGIPLDKSEIEKKCDRINSIASVLRYPQHREIQELLCEILNSIDKGDSE